MQDTTGLQVLIITLFVLYLPLYLWHKGRNSPKIYQPDNQRVYQPTQKTQTSNPVVSTTAAITGTGPRLLDVWPWFVSDEVLHLMIVGNQGDGKTTLGNALLAAWSYLGRVIIIDPHERLNDWCLNPANQGRDWQQIDQIFVRLLQEHARRYDAPKGTKFEPLTIFIDEWDRIAAKCPHAVEFMEEFATEGRKVKERLVILTHSPQVEMLGVKGKGDLRKEFGQVLLGSFARQKFPELKGKHVGVLVAQGYTAPIQVANFPALAAKPANESANFYQNSTNSVRTGTNEVRESSQESSALQSHELEISSQISRSFTISEIAKIAAQIATNERTRSEIIKSMPGYQGPRYKEFAAFYEEIAAGVEAAKQKEGQPL